ncbi:MAG: PfkB family carbohydrate kinase [Propionibacteriaceae bacterium]
MITVAGLTPSLDLTYLVDSFALGQIHRVPDVVRCAGGKALNMARAASTLGADCTVVAILGGPTGATLVELLRAEGLAVTVIESPAETRICVSVAAADSEALTEIYQEAAALPDPVLQAFVAELDHVLRRSPGWLSISGRAPAGSSQVIAELVALGGRLGIRVAIDTHGAALAPALAAGPALVKVNRYEAAELLRVPVDTDLRVMAEEVRARCGAIVVLTDGAAGSVAVDGERALRAQPPEVVGRFPVGSGDSFLGGLLAGLDAGHDLRQALGMAAASGVANALVPGQGHFTAASFAAVQAGVQIHDMD